MNLQVSTPALLFPAVSLLFLAYTNRFLHLAALVRSLHADWIRERDRSVMFQIENLKKRLRLIRWMQLLGAGSLLLCVVSMLSILFGFGNVGNGTFLVALAMMGASLWFLVHEIWASGGALAILLDQVGGKSDSQREE